MDLVYASLTLYGYSPTKFRKHNICSNSHHFDPSEGFKEILQQKIVTHVRPLLVSQHTQHIQYICHSKSTEKLQCNIFFAIKKTQSKNVNFYAHK